MSPSSPFMWTIQTLSEPSLARNFTPLHCSNTAAASYLTFPFARLMTTDPGLHCSVLLFSCHLKNEKTTGYNFVESCSRLQTFAPGQRATNESGSATVVASTATADIAAATRPGRAQPSTKLSSAGSIHGAPMPTMADTATKVSQGACKAPTTGLTLALGQQVVLALNICFPCLHTTQWLWICCFLLCGVAG